MIGGGGVINDVTEVIHKFTILEQNKELEHIRSNLDKCDPTLRLYINDFKDSAELKKYLEEQNNILTNVELIFILFLFLILFDCIFSYIVIKRNLSGE